MTEDKYAELREWMESGCCMGSWYYKKYTKTLRDLFAERDALIKERNDLSKLLDDVIDYHNKSNLILERRNNDRRKIN